MNNFNKICPSGNHIAAGNPTDELLAREDYNNTHCDQCGKETSEDILEENEGLCQECFIREARQGRQGI